MSLKDMLFGLKYLVLRLMAAASFQQLGYFASRDPPLAKLNVERPGSA